MKIQFLLKVLKKGLVSEKNTLFFSIIREGGPEPYFKPSLMVVQVGPFFNSHTYGNFQVTSQLLCYQEMILNTVNVFSVLEQLGLEDLARYNDIK